MIKEFLAERMMVRVYSDREEMGKGAASEAVSHLKQLLSEKDEVNVIFAAAPSQSEFLDELTNEKFIDWSRVNAMHLDEYIGLEKSAKELFANFLKDNIFEKVNFKNYYLMDFSNGDVSAEIARYEDILKANPLDIAFIGIGENGHIAFNDPGVANFNDPLLIKEAILDDTCRQQQVNDGCFPTIDDVPKTAATVTIPLIMSAKKIFCMVPAISKAKAVERTINGDIIEDFPSTILRTHKNATLYLDRESSKYILEQKGGEIEWKQ